MAEQTKSEARKASEPLAMLPRVDKPDWLEEMDFYRVRVTVTPEEYVILTAVDADVAMTAARTLTVLLGGFDGVMATLRDGEGDLPARIAAALARFDEQVRDKLYALLLEVLVRSVSAWTIKDHSPESAGRDVPIPAKAGTLDERMATIRRLPVRLIARIIIALIWQARNF